MAVRPCIFMSAQVDRVLLRRVYSNRFHVVARYHFTIVMWHWNFVPTVVLQKYDTECDL